MGAEIDLEKRFAAEEVYITGSVTFEELARQTGISESQLKRWAADEGWRERRQEYRRAFADIKRNTVELRRRFVEKALKSLNPMDAFAISALEKLALQAEKSAGAGAAAPQPAVEGGEPVFGTPAEAVAVLKGVVENKLRRMLVTPDSVNLNAVKDVKQALELIEKMQSRISPEEGESKSDRLLDAESIKNIREQLGL